MEARNNIFHVTGGWMDVCLKKIKATLARVPPPNRPSLVAHHRPLFDTNS